MGPEKKLSSYEQYGASYNKLSNLWKDISKIPELIELERAFKKGNQSIGVIDTSIMPIQRAPRYQLLLTELLKRVDKTNPSYPNLETTLKKMESALLHLNESMHKSVLKTLQKSLNRLRHSINIENKQASSVPNTQSTPSPLGRIRPEHVSTQIKPPLPTIMPNRTRNKPLPKIPPERVSSPQTSAPLATIILPTHTATTFKKLPPLPTTPDKPPPKPLPKRPPRQH